MSETVDLNFKYLEADYVSAMRLHYSDFQKSYFFGDQKNPDVPDSRILHFLQSNFLTVSPRPLIRSAVMESISNLVSRWHQLSTFDPAPVPRVQGR